MTTLSFGADIAKLDKDRILLPSNIATVAAWFAAGYLGGGIPGTPMEVRAMAMPGSTHVIKRESGQDAMGVAWSDRRRTLYIAVADGLSSRPGSASASSEAVNTSLLALFRDGATLAEAVAAASDRIAADSSARQASMATTLLLAEIRPTPNGARASIAAVGGSEVWILHNGQWSVLWRNRRNNVTAALPSGGPEFIPDVELARSAVLVLATDGFAAALGNGQTGLAQDLASRWSTPPSALDFASHVDFRDLGHRDDRATIAVWV